MLGQIKDTSSLISPYFSVLFTVPIFIPIINYSTKASQKPLKLFPNEPDTDVPRNLLSHDGEATYHGQIFDTVTAGHFLEELYKETPWQKDELIIYGKHFITECKVAWYGAENYEYTYSNKTRVAMLFTLTLLDEEDN